MPHPTIDQHPSRRWGQRACVRRAVALRVDYATADGRVWLGLIRNLSPRGCLSRVPCAMSRMR
jgi:hypothetical protein